MKFHRVDPSAEYRILRLRSEGGRWELGFSDYRDGTRIRMGFSGRPPSVLDFCLCHEAALYAPVLKAVLRRLGGLHESAVEKEIDAVFPWAGTRPDPAVHLPELLGGSCFPGSPLIQPIKG